MKSVQIGILVALVVVAGLLFMVWRGQHAQPALTDASAQPAATSAPDSNAVPVPAGDQPEARQPAPVEQKPSPASHSRNASRSMVAENKPPESVPAPVAVPAPPAQEQQPPPPPAPPAQRAEAPAPAPLPPPPPRSVTIPAGTTLHVRLVDSLSSDKNKPGDSFAATLDQALVVDGMVLAERGSRVEGKVVESQKAGRVKGVSDMAVKIVRLHTSDGQSVEIQTDPFEKQGETSHKSDAEKVGGGAALGAIIGAIAGGGKGAAIGAGAGGAAGGGVVLATRGKAVALPSETKLIFRLASPVTLTEKRQ